MTVDEPRRSISILGVAIDIIKLSCAVARIGTRIPRRKSRYVCAYDLHSLMLTKNDAAHMASPRNADMVTPDSMPLLCVARIGHCTDMLQVCGLDVLPALCPRSVNAGWRHYFYGDLAGIANELV